MTLPSNGVYSLHLTFIWTRAPLSTLCQCVIISVETSLLLLALSQADSCSETAAKAPESKAVGPPSAKPPGGVTPKAAPKKRGRERDEGKKGGRIDGDQDKERVTANRCDNVTGM